MVSLGFLPGHKVRAMGPAVPSDPDPVITNVLPLGIKIAFEIAVLLEKGEHLGLRGMGVERRGYEAKQKEGGYNCGFHSLSSRCAKGF
jgi:hypothetical protein